jgi:tRNA(Ile)-lysidine synthase
MMNDREARMTRQEPSTALIERVYRTVEDHGLASSGDHVLVAVSGGADSCALLWLLDRLRGRLGIDLSVAHVNHRLRGAASDGDAAFVADLARRLTLPFTVRDLDIAACRSPGESLEMAARRARYAALRDMAEEMGAAHAATGHTRDDQAETLLLKLLRGAGPGGLTGIGYETVLDGLPVIRPALDCARVDLVHLLGHEHWTWREDATNQDRTFLRNRVRHDILPYLESSVSGPLRESLVRLTRRLAQDETYLRDQAHARIAEGGDRASPAALPAAVLRDAPAALQARMVMGWLRTCGVAESAVTRDLIERVLRLADDEAGTRAAPIDEGLWVERRYGNLVVEVAETGEVSFRETIPVPGSVDVADAGLRVVAWVGRGLEDRPSKALGEWPARGTVALSSLGADTLTVRNWLPGDRIRPLGLGGSVKLQDLFVNEKFPRPRRRGYPVVECRGELVWVPGYRIAEGWQVRSPEAPSLRLVVERRTD